MNQKPWKSSWYIHCTLEPTFKRCSLRKYSGCTVLRKFPKYNKKEIIFLLMFYSDWFGHWTYVIRVKILKYAKWTGWCRQKAPWQSEDSTENSAWPGMKWTVSHPFWRYSDSSREPGRPSLVNISFSYISRHSQWPEETSTCKHKATTFTLKYEIHES